ncbi:MAG: SDR family oxidoreductase [Archangium sp.]
MGKKFTGEKTQGTAKGSQSAMKHQPDCGEKSYAGHGRMRGKTAIITGGNSGIGRAVSIAFAREGARIGVIFHSGDEDAESLAELLALDDLDVVLEQSDLSDPKKAKKSIERLTKKLGGQLDVLVNNAAYQGKQLKRFEDLDDERLEQTYAVNVFGTFRAIRAALPAMKKGASIINVVSIQAYQPSPEIVDYSSTKGALVTLTRGLSQELIKRGIRVNGIAPGPVWTPLIVQSFDERELEDFGTDNPTGRAAQPVELAPAFVLLGSDEGSYINGEILGVTGGLLLT